MSHADIFNGMTVDKWDDGWGHGDTHAIQTWRVIWRSWSASGWAGKGSFSWPTPP